MTVHPPAFNVYKPDKADSQRKTLVTGVVLGVVLAAGYGLAKEYVAVNYL